jgi:uncharacterized membrane protein YphA (DoxX/SURF4 family)
MDTKTKTIIPWVLSLLIGVLFFYSSFTKLVGDPETLKIGLNFGLDGATFKTIGIIELISIILFLIPRTGILGALLLIAYMGGAIASHLEHGESIISAVFVQSFIWVTAILRFPELKERIFGTNS